MNKIKYWLGSAVALALLVIGVQLVGQTQASAHTATASGVTTCSAGDTWSVIWTIHNDHGYGTATISGTGISQFDGHTILDSQDSNSVKVDGLNHASEVLNGTLTWPDNFSAPFKAEVFKPTNCVTNTTTPCPPGTTTTVTVTQPVIGPTMTETKTETATATQTVAGPTVTETAPGGTVTATETTTETLPPVTSTVTAGGSTGTVTATETHNATSTVSATATVIEKQTIIKSGTSTETRVARVTIPPNNTPKPPLAVTGARVSNTLFIALGLLAAGVVLLLLGRKRTQAKHRG